MTIADNTEPLRHLDVRARLDELKSLRDGWLDGYGKAPSHMGMDWLADGFEKNYPNDPSLPKPYLYPTPEGGVQVEWTIGPNEASLEICIETHRAEWFNVDLDTELIDEKQLDLDRGSAWSWLRQELRRLECEVAAAKQT